MDVQLDCATGVTAQPAIWLSG